MTMLDGCSLRRELCPCVLAIRKEGDAEMAQLQLRVVILRSLTLREAFLNDEHDGLDGLLVHLLRECYSVTPASKPPHSLTSAPRVCGA